MPAFKPETRVCALPECNETFRTRKWNPDQKFHVIGCYRKSESRKKKVAVWKECARPGCNKMFQLFRSNKAKRHCSPECGYANTHNIRKIQAPMDKDRPPHVSEYCHKDDDECSKYIECWGHDYTGSCREVEKLIKPDYRLGLLMG